MSAIRMHWGIRHKLVAMAMGISSLALLATCASFYCYHHFEAKNELVNGLTILADVLGSNCAAALMFEDRENAELTLSALRVNRHIAYASVQTDGGNAFASYHRDSLHSDESSRAELKTGAFFGEDFVVGTWDIVLDGAVIGRITLRSDLEKLNDLWRWYLSTMLPTIAAVLLLVFVAATWMQRAISAPILELAHVANRVTSEWDYTLRAHARSKDEIGTLVHAFNDMLGQIQARDDALEADQHLLEVRVAERTKDLSEEIEIRREAERRQSLLSAAIEQAAESIIITDTDGIIRYVNPGFETTTGYGSLDAVGKTLAFFKSDQDDEAHFQSLWQTVTAGAVWTGRLASRRKDGSSLQEVATISPVRDEKGQIINFVAVKRDITQEVELERQLSQAQKLEAVGSLAAGIAHEINTPIQFVGDNVRFLSEAFAGLLCVVDTVARVLAERHDDALECEAAVSLQEALEAADVAYLQDEIPRAVEQTLDGVDRVATIVRAMKDFSHPEQKDKSSTDLNRAIQSTLIVARNELKYVADIVTHFGDDIPPILCYPSDLNQAFLNLLVNAAHAIADAAGNGGDGKGTITVSTRRDGDHVVVAIADTGTGIPEKVRDRVFDHFFTTKEVGKGTGQGLSIARSVVVEKHGGDISFDTETGKGTTFYIRLPIGVEVLETVS